jgi:hypothetical protein
VNGDERRGHRPQPSVPDTDAMTLVSRALDIARRRLRYRIAAAVIVAAALMAVVVVFR